MDPVVGSIDCTGGAVAKFGHGRFPFLLGCFADFEFGGGINEAAADWLQLLHIDEIEDRVEPNGFLVEESDKGCKTAHPVHLQEVLLQLLNRILILESSSPEDQFGVSNQNSRDFAVCADQVPVRIVWTLPSDTTVNLLDPAACKSVFGLVGPDEPVNNSFEVRKPEDPVRELERLLGLMAIEVEIPR